MATLPLLTAELPGTGGLLRQQPSDFRVTEVPAYEPVGEGDHVYVRIRKRGLTTTDAVRRLAERTGVNPRDVGYAGLKDRHAITEQWISLPPPCSTDAAEGAGDDELEILEVSRHRNKLKTGHLHGNRFVLTIRELACEVDEAVSRARAILEALARPPGSPNWFGEQRFGARGDNAARGKALILGERLEGRPPKGRQKRLLISAYQSELFNRVMAARIEDGLYRSVLAGDLLKKRPTGGMFECHDPATDQARLDAGELAITGPMFGHKMRGPTKGSEPESRELEVLEAEGLQLSSFARMGKLAMGTRRPFSVDLGEIGAEPAGPDAIAISFRLPAGSYATVVAAEVVKR